uniref:Uncharacterized protein n=1 Tax=Leersia perrieri TaxID=77586 RepID=A0A0D9W9J3_9ORYZ
MAAGLLLVMLGMTAAAAPAPAPAWVFVRRAVDVAAAVLWNARGGPGLWALPMPVVIALLLLCPFLEAWFDFI